jgi:hypothetical protein
LNTKEPGLKGAMPGGNISHEQNGHETYAINQFPIQ